MSTTANIKRFIDSPPIKHILHTRWAVALITEAERCYLLRDYQGLTRLASILCRERWPKELKQVGLYYKGLVLRQQGRLADAAASLSIVADEGPLLYRGKALLSLALIDKTRGARADAKEKYRDIESLSGGKDWLTYYHAKKMQVFMMSEDGDHKRALANLVAITPLARMLAESRSPFVAYDHLNSMALELAENGQSIGAVAIAESMVTWPILDKYPEFQDTQRTLLRLKRGKARIVFTQAPVLVHNDAMSAPQVERISEQLPGRVLPFRSPQASREKWLFIQIGECDIPLFDGEITESQKRKLLKLLQKF